MTQQDEASHHSRSPEISFESTQQVGVRARNCATGTRFAGDKSRKTGKPRRTPVGDGRVGGQFWIVAEHDMQAGYVRNIAQNQRVRVKVRDGRTCYPTTILVSASAGWHVSAPALDRTLRLCGCWEPNYSGCGLTWTRSPDSVQAFWRSVGA
jgi:deazaflavin-dependent oxidoreductase (nitroreductase family)